MEPAIARRRTTVHDDHTLEADDLRCPDGKIDFMGVYLPPSDARRGVSSIVLHRQRAHLLAQSSQEPQAKRQGLHIL